ncbi:hypothetical protein PTTG_29496, partial [Puccinia triticina 1-1 BBBD Race 1]
MFSVLFIFLFIGRHVYATGEMPRCGRFPPPERSSAVPYEDASMDLQSYNEGFEDINRAEYYRKWRGSSASSSGRPPFEYRRPCQNKIDEDPKHAADTRQDFVTVAGIPVHDAYGDGRRGYYHEVNHHGRLPGNAPANLVETTPQDTSIAINTGSAVEQLP